MERRRKNKHVQSEMCDGRKFSLSIWLQVIYDSPTVPIERAHKSVLTHFRFFCQYCSHCGQPLPTYRRSPLRSTVVCVIDIN